MTINSAMTRIAQQQHPRTIHRPRPAHMMNIHPRPRHRPTTPLTHPTPSVPIKPAPQLPLRLTRTPRRPRIHRKRMNRTRLKLPTPRHRTHHPLTRTMIPRPRMNTTRLQLTTTRHRTRTNLHRTRSLRSLTKTTPTPLSVKPRAISSPHPNHQKLNTTTTSNHQDAPTPPQATPLQ